MKHRENAKEVIRDQEVVKAKPKTTIYISKNVINPLCEIILNKNVL